MPGFLGISGLIVSKATWGWNLPPSGSVLVRADMTIFVEEFCRRQASASILGNYVELESLFEHYERLKRGGEGYRVGYKGKRRGGIVILDDSRWSLRSWHMRRK